MSTPNDVVIAGTKTCADWQAFRKRLVSAGDADFWREAVASYYHQRLSLRYLGPIKVLQDHGMYQGEGFSIVAIQCSLIEFLESTVKGLTYRYLRRGEQLGPYEYSGSKDLFVSFLVARQPFANEFTQQLAEDFYEGVRCGLLHEARSKNGWTIWGQEPTGRVIDPRQKILYRNNFQAAILRFIDWYEGAIIPNSVLQQAFIRKFDSLCL
jgi:hypothetical protein